jgi:DUF4097 and DUF4098 domain-containing protein YvlB
MKKTVFLLALLCYLGAGASADARAARDNRDKPLISYRFPAKAVNSVHAVTSGGFLQVTGDASDEVTVDVFVSPNRRRKQTDEEIRKMLDEHYTVEVTETNGRLSAVAKRKGAIRWLAKTNLSISFKIHVRPKTDTQLETSGGSIKLENLEGKHDFKTSGGSLHVNNLTGTITGRTSGGSINVRNSRDNIDLQTSGGSISADECSGKISLTTSGGSLRLSNLNGTVVAKTSGGSIHMDDLAGTVNAHTSGGAIVMHRLNGEINAKTSGGSISADAVTGTLNTGTSGGSVRIKASGNVEAYTSSGTMQVEMKSVENYVRLQSNGHTHLSLPGKQGYRLDIKARKIRTARAVTNFSGSFESDRIDGKIDGGGAEVRVSASQLTLEFD